MMKLLTRDEFRNYVFERDNHKCVICKFPAQDAHHILERRLFSNGGYFPENGASLCGNCHILAEETTLSCDEIREAAGIKKICLPEHLYEDINYDKWGNPVLANGTRLKGELFFDESVQKILKQGKVLHLFSKYVKYPRTYHFPWSDCITDDDRVTNFRGLENQEIIVTEKFDGENTTMYNDYIHARSINSKSHPSQSWVRNFHSQIAHEIPEGWRICGENMFAKHSIKYENLKSFFYLFSVWNEKNQCLSWKDTTEFAQLLNIQLVPVIYAGPWNLRLITDLVFSMDTTKQEGYVVRVAKQFDYFDFKNCVAKYVRKNHVIGTHHWKYSQLEFNELCKS